MSHSVRLTLTAVLVAASTAAWGINPSSSIEELPSLKQEPQHKAASKRVKDMFTRTHYKEVSLDDLMSEMVFDRFIKQLDFNRNVFLQADLDSLNKYRHKFDEALQTGDLSAIYAIYNLSLKRRYERYAYALTLLETEMTFDKPDSYHFDREDAAWVKTEAELDELWRQRVKYDALNLKMAGKDWPAIKESLGKRYNRAIRRLNQSQSEDVFQSFQNAFARSIEAHTSYLSPRSADRFQMEMNREFEGIGAVLQARDDFTVIRSIVPGGPADKTEKIKPEDKIIGVAQEDDDEYTDVIGWRLDEVVELIKGPKGTVVKLQLIKGDGVDSTSTEEVAITRDKVVLEDRAAKGELYKAPEDKPFAPKLGVISIPSFYNNLSSDVTAEIEKLQKEGVEGLIIDLRGNGGGALTEATALTGLFIDTGPVVQIRDGAGRINVNRDRDEKIVFDGPLTVLVDRYSASASEIFAAAIQDYGRGLVIGEQTFGKGTVQQHRPLGRIYDLYEKPLGSVQFTIAKFYRINGGSTQHKGVIPDVLFPSAIVPDEWGESRAENALPWDQVPRTKYVTLGDFSKDLASINSRYQQRIKSSPEFAYIHQDIEEYNAEKGKKVISLVEKERKAEREESKAKRLARANERLKRAGKEAVKSLDDVPDDIYEIDPFLDETANIMKDVMELGYYVKAKTDNADS